MRTPGMMSHFIHQGPRGKYRKRATLGDRKCIKCGEKMSTIRKYDMLCGIVNSEGEILADFGKHKFNAWSSLEEAERLQIAELKQKFNER
jgi:ribosomal protein S14